MPRPPVTERDNGNAPIWRDDVSSLLGDLLAALSEEREAAVRRHQDVLGNLLQHHDDFKREIAELRNNPRFSSAGFCESEAQFNSEQSGPSPRPTSAKPRTSSSGSKARHGRDFGIMPSLDSLTNSINLKTDMVKRIFAGDREAQEAEVSTGTKRFLSKRSTLGFGTKEEEQSSSWIDFFRVIVHHASFEAMMACMILGNALVMCLEVQKAGLQVGCDMQFKDWCEDGSREQWPGADFAFQICDWVFGVIFILEATAKIIVESYRYFCDAWNCFDFLCVLAFCVDKLATALPGSLDSGKLRLLRLMRLMRLVRLLRTLEALDALYIMTTAIKGMRLIVFWAMCLLGVALTMCTLILTNVLHSTYFDDESIRNASTDQLVEREEMFEYFGSFTRCLFSMFELTLANWPTVSRKLIEGSSPWFMPLCLVHKLTLGFAVLGVINGVILQETFKVASTDDMIMVRQKKREKEVLIQKMKKLFEALDYSENGELDFEEFTTIAQHEDVKHWLASMDIETHDLQMMFNLIDADGNGQITLEELVLNMPRLKGSARTIDLLALCKLVSDPDAFATRELRTTFLTGPSPTARTVTPHEPTSPKRPSGSSANGAPFPSLH